MLKTTLGRRSTQINFCFESVFIGIDRRLFLFSVLLETYTVIQ